MLDPTLIAIARATLAALFFAAGLEKLRAPEWFAGVLREYRLLPEASVAALARLFPALEIVAAAGLVYAPTAAYAAALVLVLLAVFSAAVLINLYRGRRDIDCGCWGALADGGGELSLWLVLRNLVLGLLASAPLLPMSARPAAWLDYLTIAAATVVLLFLFGIANRLAALMPRLAKLRSLHE